MFVLDLSCGSRGWECLSSCDGEIGDNLQCETEGEACCLPNVRKYLDPDTRKPGSAACETQRRRPDCASAQSDQRLCYSLSEKYLYSSCC